MTNPIPPKVFVVVLNFNGKKTLTRCLRSVFQSDYPNLETVVVDNRSQDGSFEEARQIFSRAHFIQNPDNLGFGAGNNIGIRFSLEKMADYVFLLNNDAFLEKNSLSGLVSIAEKNPTAGIVSPVIYAGDGKTIWFSGGKINWWRMKTVHRYDFPSSDPYLTEYVSGCAMLVKKDVFKEIGLFDENFFLYYEDADLSYRAAKAGFSLLVAPQVKTVHLEQSSADNAFKVYWLVFSGLYFFYKSSPLWFSGWIRIFTLLRYAKNYRDRLRNRANHLAADIGKAYADFFRSKKTGIFRHNRQLPQ